LADVDLQVAAGELLALVGANGSGKSTVLKLMVGLSRPSSGTVRRNARVVSYVPDVFTSHDRLSASAYLRHMGRIRGLSTRAARERSDELLERLALAGGADTPMRKLSKGNAQKVALAQALVEPPELPVLDEPWGSVTLILPTGRHDAALLTALNHGWSVTTVRQVAVE
jgi:ABC-type multidrug transport system ATPase subunit